MRAPIFALAAAWTAVSAWSCGGDPSPAPPVCLTSADSLTFDSLLPPQFSGDPRVSERRLTLTNEIETVSGDGNADLVGTLVIALESQTTVPPVIRPKGSDPAFRIPPRESVTWTIEAVVKQETSPGFYSGFVDVGSSCAPIPFTILVAERPQPPPRFLRAWGTRGSGRSEFESPTGIAADAQGSVYVLDVGNNNVQRFDADGTFRDGWSEWWEADRDTFPTHFLTPGGIAVDAQGFVYVTDREPEHTRDRITKFDPLGTAVARFGPTQGGSDIERPWHLGIDSRGWIYFIEIDRKRIVILEPIRGEWENRGRWGLGRWLRAVPQGLAISPLGFVYVSDWFNHRVLKFSKNGEFLLQWGRFGTGLGEFKNPVGLAVDAEGNVYVADSRNARIQKFNPNGAPLTEWGSVGAGGGQFVNPVAVAVGQDGLIFVADTGNRRVQVFEGASGDRN